MIEPFPPPLNPTPPSQRERLLEPDKPWHEGPPLLVESGPFRVDRGRGAGHGVHMRKPHAGFCPMAKEGHAHWFHDMRKKCLACQWNPLELTERQKRKAADETAHQMRVADEYFKNTLTAVKPGSMITYIPTAKPNPAAQNVIQR